MEIVWDDTALSELNKTLDYISRDSPPNALKVADAIVKVCTKIIKYPYIYPPDKYKKNNDNTYRALQIYRMRISYKIETERILIVRCRHTAQRPSYF